MSSRARTSTLVRRSLGGGYGVEADVECGNDTGLGRLGAAFQQSSLQPELPRTTHAGATIVMDEDVDMDAPQISTLREEDTPPPARNSKLKVKLLVSDKKGKGKSSSPSVPTAARKSIQPIQPQSRPPSDEEPEEEDEEDQLIDDDELAPSISAPSASTGTKRKAPQKKAPRPRKSDKQDEKKPEQPQEPPENEDGQSASAAAPPEKPPPKKKAAPRKPAAPKPPKIKVPPKGAKALAVPPLDDTAMSETHTVTAPSSPFPHSQGASAEPEEVEPLPPPVSEGPGESVPMPVYPLPSKPFPVQPPPKIGTGFAPVQPLERTGAKARQWRIANREIRGIAGGRWFARSWVGDKESEFANAVAAASAKAADGEKTPLPKAVTSISAPAGKKSKAARASAGISAAPSRSGSIVPELHTPKAPTKMRNIIAGPASEVGDEPEVVVPEAPSISAVS